MEPVVQAFLEYELACFVANVFQVAHSGMRVGREEGVDGRESEARLFGVGQSLAATVRFIEVGPKLLEIETLERESFLFLEKHGLDYRGYGTTGSGADGRGSAECRARGGDRAERSETAGTLALGLHRPEAETAANGFDDAVSFFAEGVADVADFIVDRFEGDLGGHPARDVILQRGAKHAARDCDDEQPHQNARKGAAKMKAAVEEDKRKAQKAEPQMAAHPGWCSAKAPGGDAFPCTKERGKDHKREAEDAETEADGAATTWASGSPVHVDDVDGCTERENSERSEEPTPLRVIHSHAPLNPVKNLRGSTRCAASCGHA